MATPMSVQSAAHPIAEARTELPRESIGTHVAETLRLAAPITMVHFSYLATMMATLALFGLLAPEALAAGGLSLRMAASTFVVSGPLICVGISIAKAQGARDTGRIPALYWNGLYLSVALASVSFAWLSAGEPILTALNQPPEVVRQTDECLKIIRWAELANVIRLGLMRSALPAFGLGSVLYLVTPVTLAIYVLLSWALVGGHLGLPQVGWQGIPIAQVVAMVVSAMAMLIAVHGTRFRRMIPIARPDLAVMGGILRQGLPIGLQMAVDGAFFLVMALFVGQIGAVPLAAHQIVHTFGTICYVLAASCGDSAALRIGFRRGAKRFQDAGVAGYVAFALGMLGMAGAALAILAVPELFIGVFLDIHAPENAAVLEFCLHLIPVCAVYVMADGLFGVGMGLQRGLQDNAFSLGLVAVSYWGIGFPVGYGLYAGAGMGAIGIWWGLIAGLSAIGFGSLARYGVLSRRAAATAGR